MIIGEIMLRLNTSHVKVKLKDENRRFNLSNSLNTSHVKVKFGQKHANADPEG